MLLGAAALAAGAVPAGILSAQTDLPGVRAVGAATVEPVSAPIPTQGGLPAPLTLDDVLRSARACAGVRLLSSPWAPATGDRWSAQWLAWLLRGLTPALHDTSAASLLATLRPVAAVSTSPQVGALVFYSDGATAAPVHVGFVVSVVGGVPQVLEGDHPITMPPSERFVRLLPRPGEGKLLYALPRYEA